MGRYGIPALTDPLFVSAKPGPDNDYVLSHKRVVGLILDGKPLAIPHNVLWWHEIVNLNRGGEQLAVTYCPLTGSSIVFDRASEDGDESGVSGLLWQNNLIMYDRRTNESLWPQMLGQAGCGPATGQSREHYHAIEMTWDGWKNVHPNTEVVSASESLGRDWRIYPYGDYESLAHNALLFGDAMPPRDPRRPAKERILGIPGPMEGGIAFPFGALEDLGEVGAVEAEVGGEPVVVFWNTELQAAAAYRPVRDGMLLTFSVRDGAILDNQTGGVWNIHGESSRGAENGARLEPVAEAYVAFWGAWAAFHPETELWEGYGPEGG